MPTYQYRCPIGHEFERFEKMSGRPRTKCPQCGRAAVRIISGGAGLIFKGSGFYITDYRSKAYQEAAKKEAPASAAKEKSSGGKESKTPTEKTTPPALSPTKPKKESAA